jgi:hypothetical protein
MYMLIPKLKQCFIFFCLLKAKVGESWHLAHHFGTQETKDFLGNERHGIVTTKDHTAIYRKRTREKTVLYTRVAIAMNIGFHA